MWSLVSLARRTTGGQTICSVIRKLPLRHHRRNGVSQNQRIITFATVSGQDHPQRFDSLFEDVPAEKQATKKQAKKIDAPKPQQQQQQSRQSQAQQLIPTTTGVDENLNQALTPAAVLGAQNLETHEPITPNWKGIQDRNQKLHQILSTLQPISLPLLLNTTQYNNEHDLHVRQELFHATEELLAAVQQAVQRGEIDPTGRKGREVAVVLASIMNLYSASYHQDENHSVFKACSRVLALLDMWNLSRQEPHYHYSILAAVQEQQWEEAAGLFMQQIDGQVSGFSPVAVSIPSPFALYAMARAAQASEAVVVESVMYATNDLVLISPTDQDTCENLLVPSFGYGLLSCLSFN